MTVSLLPGEIASDLFCGGGGFSLGWQWATGRSPEIGLNHNPHAIMMHAANHPDTRHYEENVFDLDAVRAAHGRKVGWLHLSPDCTHFSRAKGGTPKDQGIRSLAMVAVDWAKAVKPRVISLENVMEFTTWGPLDKRGKPIKSRAGEDFHRFISALESHGYRVEWRQLNAADFGAPTARRRLFLVARCDGLPITWPAPTHGPGLVPYRTAAECIDWSLPCPSIFTRKKPLVEATCRRIAEGLRRFVLENPRPYLVNLTHGARLETLDEPLRTVTGAHRGEKALVTPLVVGIDNSSNGAADVWSVERPLTTVTGEARHALAAATLIQAGYGERRGQSPRVLDLGRPLGTIVAGGSKHALVTAWLDKHYGSARAGSPLDAPVPTITGGGDCGGGHASVVAATFLQQNYGSSQWQHPESPLHTITGNNHHTLVAAFLSKFYGHQQPGGNCAHPGEPMPTVRSKDGLALVTVQIQGEPYVVADIGLRMLQPRELARAQGFPDTYVMPGTKSEQVARIGNSVVPQVARALVEANLGTVMEVAA